jgi:hypothetical protein
MPGYRGFASRRSTLSLSTSGSQGLELVKSLPIWHPHLFCIPRAIEFSRAQAADTDCHDRDDGRAYGRPPFAPITHDSHTLSVFVCGFLLLLIVYDLWSMHRVHPVTVRASLFVFIAQELRIPIGTTRSWLAFAGWVQHFARLH